MGACLRSSPPTQSRASRLRHWRLNFRCIGNGYDYASVSYTSVFLTQVYLNFRAIPPCKPKTSTYTVANIPEKLRKLDMPQVRITCVSLWRLHSKSICLLFQTSRLNIYFASSFSQFAYLQLIMSSKQVDVCWRTARNRHTSSREIAATHNKQRHICPSAEMSRCQQKRSFARITLVTWMIAVWSRWRFL